MRCGVDEVAKGRQCGGQTNCGSVQGDDENLGVVVEGICDVEVVGDEIADDLAAGIVAVGRRASGLDVGAAGS